MARGNTLLRFSLVRPNQLMLDAAIPVGLDAQSPVVALRVLLFSINKTDSFSPQELSRALKGKRKQVFRLALEQHGIDWKEFLAKGIELCLSSPSASTRMRISASAWLK
eukprot:TRINITY_DN27294_c0_g1_i2.p1 TRINITY_DN27294_c0_g1~~TRINITY_DN27294_c0_g1_i2.p1  ORF type:complete len:109 (+),score=9.67 TRINITY_DN27294_c0_g1_i2:307-633(+)